MRRIWLALSFTTAGLTLVGTSSLAIADESSTGADERQEQDIRALLPGDAGPQGQSHRGEGG